MAVKLSIKNLLKITKGALLEGGRLEGQDTLFFEGVVTDSRKSFANELFIPLVGDVHDAHAFIDKAVENGAQFILTHKKDIKLNQNIFYILVEDTLCALQDLASYWRSSNNYKVLAISGSNGKTTSKEYATAVISQYLKVTSSKGSFNNHWGVPLTILNSSGKDDVLILEMGMNHLGELKLLSQIGQQNVSVLTTVGRAHVGEVGSLEKIVQAKKELYDNSPEAVHIFNLDNQHTKQMHQNSVNSKMITFSAHDLNADIHLYVKEKSIEGLLVAGTIQGESSEVLVPVLGQHNVYNMMVAAALALSCGLSSEQIWQALPVVKGAWGRCESLKTSSGVNVLFDAYNANPESVLSLHQSIQGLKLPGKKIFIFGDMLEMGIESEQLHLDVFTYLSENYDCVWYIGEHKQAAQKFFSGAKCKFMYSAAVDKEMALELYKTLHKADTVIMKGSRGVALEGVVQAWGVDYSKQD